MEDGSWHPFRLIRGGLPISHLFFADDLILYAKATVDQAVLISTIRDEFGYFSGHKVLESSYYFYGPNAFVWSSDCTA
ncbi:hypothetical protein V6N12_073015 [Hibiscus sabdariffa]